MTEYLALKPSIQYAHRISVRAVPQDVTRQVLLHLSPKYLYVSNYSYILAKSTFSKTDLSSTMHSFLPLLYMCPYTSICPDACRLRVAQWQQAWETHAR